MASYRQKYVANCYYPGMGLVQLVILEKNYNGSSFLIGNLQGLSLEVGGGNEPPYAPVIKTTLRLTIADAFDVGTTYNGVTCVTTQGNNRVKNGQWEEFYTNDATKYKVQLIYLVTGSGRPQRQTVFWQGFITPDSWQESMVYRGSITVVARDMLGSLSDYTFDAVGVDGSISVGDLVTLAVQKCGAAMSVSFDADKALRNVAEDVSIFGARIWVKAFEGKSWWTALTETLESLGLVMRYNGNGAWKVVSLRWLPDVQNTESHYAEFINRSGIRTLDPPVRDIESTFSLETKDVETPAPDPEDFTTGEDVTIITQSPALEDDGQLHKVTITTRELASASGGYDTPESGRPSLLAPPHFALNDPLNHAPLYFLANTYDAEFGWISNTFTKVYGSAPTQAGFFSAPCQLVIKQNGEITTANLYGVMSEGSFFNPKNPPYVKSVSLYISATFSGVTKYYQGRGIWLDGVRKTREDEAGVAPFVANMEGASDYALNIYSNDGEPDAGSLVVDVVHVEVSPWSAQLVSSTYLFFVPLSLVLAPSDASGIASEYSVKTLYNPDYNVSIERSPAIGSITTNLSAQLFTNVLLSPSGTRVLPDSWNFPNTDQGYPLEVMVQGQVLMYYAAPLSIFTGSLHDKTFPVAVPFSSYSYYGRICNVQRGTYDFITGYVRDVALREIMFWGQAWPQFSPNYTIQEKHEGSGSGGGRTGGGGGGGGNSSAAINQLAERVELLDSLIGEDENHDAYVKPYGETAREFKNAGGIHARALTLGRSTSPSGTVDLEVITYTDENDEVHEYLHTRLPFASDQDISAGGRGSGGGGGGGGTAVAWGNDAANGYETLVVEGYTGNQRRVALQGHLHAVADIFTGIGTSTPSVGQTLVYGQNGWAYGSTGGVASVIGLTGAITQAQLRTALGLGAAAYRGVADAVSYHGTGLVTAGLLFDELSTRDTTITGLDTRIGAVETLIPSEASASNMLATESQIPTQLGQLAETTTGAGSWHFTTAYKNLLDSLENFAQMFELLGSGTSADPYLIHAFYPLYSDGYIAAGGRGSGGGGGGGGATYLGQLEDVTLTNPAYRQVLWMNNSGAWVNHRLEIADVNGLSSEFGNYVTLATAQTISGQKTFSAAPLPSGTAIDLGSSSARWRKLYAKGGDFSGNIRLKGSDNYGNKINFGDGEYAYIAELTDDVLTIYGENGIRLVTDRLITAEGDFVPATAATLDLGSSSKAWNGLYCKRWYPVQGNNSIYVEYNAEYGAFYFKGNVVASGYIAAGGRGPSET